VGINEKRDSKNYMNLIQYMNEDSSTGVKSMSGVTEDFNVGVGEH